MSETAPNNPGPETFYFGDKPEFDFTSIPEGSTEIPKVEAPTEADLDFDFRTPAEKAVDAAVDERIEQGARGQEIADSKNFDFDFRTPQEQQDAWVESGGEEGVKLRAELSPTENNQTAARIKGASALRGLVGAPKR